MNLRQCVGFFLAFGVLQMARGELPALNGVAPDLCLAQWVDYATLDIRTNMRQLVGEDRDKAVGKTLDTRVKVADGECTYQLRIADLDVSTVGGEKVDPKELARRLKNPTPVLMCTPDGKVPRVFIELFREDVLVLHVRSAAGVGWGKKRPE